MKLIAQIKLLPTPQQADALRLTLERANAACDAISTYAFEHKVFRQYDLHRALYAEIKASFNLSAQVVVRCLGKVADAYKTTGHGGMDRERQRTFRKHGAIAFDSRILAYYTERQEVSIWTLGGRERIPYACGERQRAMLAYQKGESDLVYRRGAFYLLATCDLPDPSEEEVDAVLGVDLGITSLATDSDGEVFNGAHVEEARAWYAGRRATLQAVGTKSAKRRLKQLSGRQRRFQSDSNHVISKRLVRKAQDTKRAIALEDLTHIRKRTTVQGRWSVPRGQRAKHHNWAFYQLRAFVTYKAQMAGVPVVLVDPRYTSRTCYVCGHNEKANRKPPPRGGGQSEFVCRSGGHTMNADFNAALNIAGRAIVHRAEVNRPMVSSQVSTYGAAA